MSGTLKYLTNFDNFKITKIEGPSYMGIGNVHDENKNIYT